MQALTKGKFSTQKVEKWHRSDAGSRTADDQSSAAAAGSKLAAVKAVRAAIGVTAPAIQWAAIAVLSLLAYDQSVLAAALHRLSGANSGVEIQKYSVWESKGLRDPRSSTIVYFKTAKRRSVSGMPPAGANSCNSQATQALSGAWRGTLPGIALPPLPTTTPSASGMRIQESV
jgi:hypothetical protein